MLPAALLDPAVYPHAAPDPALVETHISWIVLAGDYAYKLKKPLRFAFLDYSTTALRRAACVAEVTLNRRWAPALYLGVSELVATAAGPRFDQPGTPIEPAVRMRRFDRRLELDALVARGEARADELAGLGAAVAGWQAAASAGDPAAAAGSPDDALAAARENLETLATPGLPVPPAEVAALAAWIEREHAALVPGLAARRAAGRIRECHGDLHAGNVVRLDGALTPFDGIEFSPRLRTIDVASDAAFLAMDLARRGRPDLAAAFADGWFAASGDYAAAGVWRWFLTYRALVRAKVLALRAQQATDAATRASAWAECRGYIAAAAGHARAGTGRLVITCGPSGSGKSRLAAALVTALPAIRIRADVERKRLAGHAPAERHAAAADAGLYAPTITQATYAWLLEAAGGLVRAGLDVIVDATFQDPRQRHAAAATARAAGAGFAILECTAPAALLRARVAARRDDPSDATTDILERQLRGWQGPAAGERACTVRVDTSTAPDAPSIAAAVRAAAARPAD